MIFDPMGKVLLDCGEKEGVHVSPTALDKALVARTRERFPFLKDRKPLPVKA
jgi:predicted amidohydrolase